MSSVENHLNKAIFIASAHPATHDAAGFAALTWVQVNGLQILPQLGRTHDVNYVDDLTAGEKVPVKGAAQGQDTTGTHYTVEGDQGQVNLKNACDDGSGVIAVRIVQLDGPDAAPTTGNKVEFAKGLARSFLPNQGDSSNHDGFTWQFAQHGTTVAAAIA